MWCRAVAAIIFGVLARFVYREYLDIIQLENVSTKNYTAWKGSFKDGDSVERHLSEFVQIQTVSDYDKELHVSDKQVFLDALSYLEKTYPLIWSSLKIQKVNELSLLMEWKGSDSTLLPMLYMGHYDVVPVVNETIDSWEYPPFSGQMAHGFLWGRGSMDMKCGVISVLEAINHLLSEGFKPRRTLYYALGHDEEVGGGLGARSIAAKLQKQGVELELVVDEGGINIVDGLGSINGPLSIVGVAEKGYVSYILDIVGSGGHSSMPPLDASSVPSIMSRFVARLDANPPPVSLKLPVQQMLKALAPNAPLHIRPFLRRADNSLVQPLLAYSMSQTKSLASLVRTTAAVTKIQAGVADNVLPQAGRMLINYRTLPEEGSQAALEHLNTIIGKDADKINITQSYEKLFGEPSVFSPWSGPHWEVISQAIQEVMQTENGTPIVAPFMMMGGTDSRHYLGVSRHGAYRYLPMSLYYLQGDHGRIHNVNERIRLGDMQKSVVFHTRLISLFDQM